ncbi:hypothetical protein [Pseudalkalibacillus sp. SCS-8]|uniref:hypothetical protein n=1 Tax=Pseudalkalibacillus nanhaiensis TaxID=3115291 RepID=UPI0032DA7B1C
MMYFTPDLAKEWTRPINYKVDYFYHFDYAVRSIILVLVGFGSFLSGLLVVILDHFFGGKTV